MALIFLYCFLRHDEKYFQHLILKIFYTNTIYHYHKIVTIRDIEKNTISICFLFQ